MTDEYTPTPLQSLIDDAIRKATENVSYHVEKHAEAGVITILRERGYVIRTAGEDAAHDAAVAAKAWDEGYSAAVEYVDGPDWAAPPPNPHRENGGA